VPLSQTGPGFVTPFGNPGLQFAPNVIRFKRGWSRPLGLDASLTILNEECPTTQKTRWAEFTFGLRSGKTGHFNESHFDKLDGSKGIKSAGFSAAELAAQGKL
jgi:hypothetical protein